MAPVSEVVGAGLRIDPQIMSSYDERMGKCFIFRIQTVTFDLAERA